jgi:hypothetical protein
MRFSFGASRCSSGSCHLPNPARIDLKNSAGEAANYVAKLNNLTWYLVIRHSSYLNVMCQLNHTWLKNVGPISE